MGNIFDTLFVIPITNLLVALFQLFTAIGLPYALGFSIIGLTILIRLLLYPLMSSQIKATSKMQKIAPHLANIKAKHKNDKTKQQQEMMRLYKEHGVNPAAGCLPTIIQFPIIIALYNVLNTTVGATTLQGIHKINEVLYFPFLKINSLWDIHFFFGTSLADSPSKIISQAPLIVLVPVITGVLQLVLSKMMIVAQPQQAKKEKKEDFQSDFTQAMQTQSMYIFPFMIGFFSFSLPLGLSLYWNTFTIFGILQQYLLVGWGGLAPWIQKIRPVQAQSTQLTVKKK